LDYCEQGHSFPSGDATVTQDQANETQRNYQAIHIIKTSLTSKEYDKVDGLNPPSVGHHVRQP
jgi:DNA-binding CsgD family transcriptional regulator